VAEGAASPLEMRLRQALGEEAQLEARLEADSRERQAELAALHSELLSSADRWREEVGLQETEHLRLQRENTALAERVAAAAGERQKAGSDRVRMLWSGRQQAEVAAASEGLRRELAGRTRQVRSLAAALTTCEEKLAAQPSAADAGAQRDVLRVLQRTAARLNSRLRATTEEAEALEEERAQGEMEEACAEEGRRRLLRQGGGSAGAEALVSMQKHLARLRHMYVAMGRRCEGFEHRLDSEGGLLADRRELLERSEERLRALSGELGAAERRCAGVRQEEARLEAAAEQDRRTLEGLRRQLQRSNARNAGLEVEAQLLGFPPTAPQAERAAAHMLGV